VLKQVREEAIGDPAQPGVLELDAVILTSPGVHAGDRREIVRKLGSPRVGAGIVVGVVVTESPIRAT